MRLLALGGMYRLAAIAAFAALVLPALSLAQQGSDPAPAVATSAAITVEFSDPQLSPSHWVLSFHADGSGHFQSTTEKGGMEAGGAASSTGAWTAVSTGNSQEEMQIPNVNRDVQLSPRFAAAAFQAAKRETWFNEPCESHQKVAFQGWKTLSYTGPEGKGSCTFNYSRDKEIQSLGNSFVAVANTILEGVRLEMLLQHDPLGLEKEIESLTAAVQDGSAQQICVIKGILQRLAQDDNVMEMVRKRARLLLARADS